MLSKNKNFITLRIILQMWYETDKNELVLGQMLCMEAAEKISKLGKCHEMRGNQDWRHKRIVSCSIVASAFKQLC